MNERVKNIVVVVVFGLFLISFFLINVIKSDTLISVSERRKLKQFPEFSSKKLFDGTFFTEFDDYVTDQFVKRDEFRSLKVNLELKIKNNYNNLYIYDGSVINQLYPLSTNSVTKLIDKVNFIKNNYLENNKVYFSIIPDKNYFVNNGNLKLDYQKLESMMVSDLDYATYIDIFDLLNLDNYYKTDTHWKQETLVDVVKEFSKQMNFEISGKYEVQEITKFLGVYAGQLPSKYDYESINILTNKVISNSKVYNYETKLVTDVYDSSKVNAIDKYDIYLSGAVPLVTITNSESTNNKELVVFRDSFGSSLIPLFIEGYYKITVVDTRYISPKVLDQFIEFNDQDVLFLYNTLIINDSSSLK